MKKFLQNIQNKLKSFDFYDTFLHSINYFGAVILINALGVISIPVYTRLLSVEDYGTMEIYHTLCKIGIILFTLNAYNAVFRYYFDDKTDTKAFVGSSLMLSMGLICLSFIILFFSADWLSEQLNIPSPLFLYTFPVIISTVILSVYYQIHIARKESKKVSIMEVVMSYSRFIFALIFLWFVTRSYMGKVYGDLIAFPLMGLYALYRIKDYIHFGFKIEHWHYIRTFSLPLIIGSLGFLLLNYFDQLMIYSMLGERATGLYSFAYKIGFLLAGLIAALDKAAKTDYFVWMNEKAYGKVESQVKSMAKILTLGAGFLTLFAYDLGMVLAGNKEFTASIHLVPVLVLGFWFTGVYQVYQRGLQYRKKTFYISVCTVAAGLVNIVLNYFFIPLYGYEAAAYTTVASFVMIAVICLILCKIVIADVYMPSLRHYALYLVYVLSVIGAFYAIQANVAGNYWGMLGVKCAVFGLLGLLLFGDKIKLVNWPHKGT